MKQNVNNLSDVDLIECYKQFLSEHKVFFCIPLHLNSRNPILAGFDAADIKFVSKNEQGIWKMEL